MAVPGFTLLVQVFVSYHATDLVMTYFDLERSGH